MFLGTLPTAMCYTIHAFKEADYVAVAFYGTGFFAVQEQVGSYLVRWVHRASHTHVPNILLILGCSWFRKETAVTNIIYRQALYLGSVLARSKKSHPSVNTCDITAALLDRPMSASLDKLWRKLVFVSYSQFRSVCCCTSTALCVK